MENTIKKIIVYILLVIVFGLFAGNVGIALLHPHSSYEASNNGVDFSRIIVLAIFVFVILAPAIIVNLKYKEEKEDEDK